MRSSIESTSRSRLSQWHPRRYSLASMAMDEPSGARVRGRLSAVPFSIVGARAIEGVLEVRRHTPPNQPEQIGSDVAAGDDAGPFVGTVVLGLNAGLDLASRWVGYALEIRSAEKEAP